MTTNGISRREYARQRGVDEKSIRKAIEDGRIAVAVLENGRIDPELADRLWDAATIGNAAAATLVEARSAKLVQSCLALQDEADEIARDHISVAECDEAATAVTRLI